MTIIKKYIFAVENGHSACACLVFILSATCKKTKPGFLPFASKVLGWSPGFFIFYDSIPREKRTVPVHAPAYWQQATFNGVSRLFICSDVLRKTEQLFSM